MEREFKSKSNKLSAKTIAIVMTLLAIVGFATAGYFYTQMQNTNSAQKAKEESAKKIEDLRAEVGKIIQLPDEKPVVLDVTDIEKIKEQPFFKDAKVGNKVLLFPTARKAVIYDTQEKKIVNSGPIAITSTKDKAGEKKN